MPSEHPVGPRVGPPSGPTVGIVVLAYDMARELPRTLRTLAPDYQRGIDADDYDVVVMDNGSPTPLQLPSDTPMPSSVRLYRIEQARPAPGDAANLGRAVVDGDLLGLLIDGARLASPGLLASAKLASRLAPRPVIATLGWHLGTDRHMDAAATGYDRDDEDRLLAGIDWESDGYRLFSISTLAASSSRGWFGRRLGESNALFMPRVMWDELGGIDTRFSLPGGGLSNHDLFSRACALPGAQLILLLGEGTFHQIHGGAATSRRLTWDEMNAEYTAIRGHPFTPPDIEPLYVGSVPREALPHVQHSAQVALAAERRVNA